MPSPVPMAAPGCLKQPREVPADGVALEQPREGCFLFIPLLPQHLEEEEEATYARVQKSPPENQEIYANMPSAPQTGEEPRIAVRRA